MNAKSSQSNKDISNGINNEYLNLNLTSTKSLNINKFSSEHFNEKNHNLLSFNDINNMKNLNNSNNIASRVLYYRNSLSEKNIGNLNKTDSVLHQHFLLNNLKEVKEVNKEENDFLCDVNEDSNELKNPLNNSDYSLFNDINNINNNSNEDIEEVNQYEVINNDENNNINKINSEKSLTVATEDIKFSDDVFVNSENKDIKEIDSNYLFNCFGKFLQPTNLNETDLNIKNNSVQMNNKNSSFKNNSSTIKIPNKFSSGKLSELDKSNDDALVMQVCNMFLDADDDN